MQAALKAIKTAATSGELGGLNLTVNIVHGIQVNASGGEEKGLRQLAGILLSELGEEEVRKRVRKIFGEPASKGAEIIGVAELLVDPESPEEK
jgi:hypothetical protein